MDLKSSILNILSQAHSDKVTISQDGLIQLNMFVNKVAYTMIAALVELVTENPTNNDVELVTRPRPIDGKSVETIIKLLFPFEYEQNNSVKTDLATYLVKNGKIAQKNKGKDLIFPTDIIKTLLRGRKFRVEEKAEIMFSSSLQELTEDLIFRSGIAANQNGSSTIEPKWLKLVLQYINEMKELADSINFEFM